MHTLESLISEHPYVLLDGAMGTMLFAAGLEHGHPPELWNLEHPELVMQVHRGYLQAGARVLLTNTFGGNRLRLALHGAQGRVAELNRAAASLLRQVVIEDATNGRPAALIAGDIGPTGGVLTPYGELPFEQARETFAEQAAALIDGGVDLIWIETMADLEEVRAAVEAVRQVSAGIPVVTTMTFDTHGRTMMGVTPEQAAEALLGFGAAAIGGNCGNGPQEVITVVEKMHAATPQAVLVAKANAGVPTLVGGRPVYRATPADLAGYAVQARAAGARLIGACCGSTPEHIRAIADALTSEVPV
jgi:5-methyltetrahydrofolate--homocysteine methyltransferase